MTDSTDSPPILDPEQALALWRWAWDQLDTGLRHQWRSRGELAESLLDILTFVVCELTLAGRYEWLAQLPELLRMHRGWLIDEDAARHKCLETIADLLHHGAPVGKVVQALARDRDPFVRLMVARGLRVADPDARALLETLTTDRARAVRGVARQRLPEGPPVAWWAGIFDSDPIPRLPDPNDEQIAALRTVALFAERDANQQQSMIPQLVAALARVPDVILFELVRRVVIFDWFAPGDAPMLAELLRRPQGVAVLWTMLVARLGRSHDWPHDSMVLTQLCRGWDGEVVERLCRGLLQGLVEHRHSRSAEHMTQLVGAVLRDLWPATLPGALLLDAWQTLAGDAPKLAERLLPLLSRDRVDLRSEFGRLLSLADSDSALMPALSSVVSKLEPESRHAFVVRGLASDNDGMRALALGQLAELPPDPSQDTFARYWAEPALRRAILADDRLCEIFCPQLRRQLRAQALGLHEAAKTLEAVGRLWGGVSRAQIKVNEDQAASLERAAAWHQHATELGPPTDREWASWRALRRQALADEPEVSATTLLLVRPAGPLDPDDREVIDWLLARWRRVWATACESGDPRADRNLSNDTLKLYFALSKIEEPHVLAVFEELLATIEGQLDEFMMDMIEERIQQLRAALAG